MTVARLAEPDSRAASQVIHERHGVLAIAATDQPRGHELGVGIDRRPGPGIARTVRRSLRRRDVLLFRIGEAPNFIDLDALGREIAYMLIVIGRARLAGIDHQLDDGVLARAGQPCDGSDRAALAKQVEDAGAVGGRELFHTDHNT